MGTLRLRRLALPSGLLPTQILQLFRTFARVFAAHQTVHPQIESSDREITLAAEFLLLRLLLSQLATCDDQ
ncbi:hypothetical protein CK219_26970 [Mesorhizobium sp. WSM4313]|nr:hypothetical protein CK219_26970 [Mesorhizobium sp. WSM4313]